MSHEPPALQRIAMEFEHIAIGPTRVKSIELEYGESAGFHSDTLPLNVSFSCSSTDGGVDGKEPTVSELDFNASSKKSARTIESLSDDESDDDKGDIKEATMLQKQKLIFLSFSVLPFLIASSSLAVVMAWRRDSSPSPNDVGNDSAYATSNLASSSHRTSAPTFAPPETTTKTDVDMTATVDTRRPSSLPTSSVGKGQATKEGDLNDSATHGGLRSTTSPTTLPSFVAYWNSRCGCSRGGPCLASLHEGVCDHVQIKRMD